MDSRLVWIQVAEVQTSPARGKDKVIKVMTILGPLDLDNIDWGVTQTHV